MADQAEGEENSLQAGTSVYRRVGHKGADAIVEGNTLESFEAAVSCGVDMVEIDVLRDREGRLIIAHDYEDARSRRPLELTQALDAFLDPPLDQVELDCDLKLPGREAELAGALAGHGLVERAMVSTMEIESLRKLRQLEPDLRLGWTYPKTRRDWTQHRWAGPGIAAGLATMRRRFPKVLLEKVDELDVDAVWVYHQVVTPKLVEAAEEAGVELITWTVDELDRMVELLEMGVHGVVSNDPRLFAEAERIGAGWASGEEDSSKQEAKQQKQEDKRAKKDEKKAAKQAKKDEKDEKGAAKAGSG